MTEQSKIKQQIIFHAILVSNMLKGRDKTSNVYEIRDVLASQGNDMQHSEIMHYIEELIKVKLIKFFDPERSDHRFYTPTELGRKRWAMHQANIKEEK